jgi:predicted Ser/Thr protein kinase
MTTESLTTRVAEALAGQYLVERELGRGGMGVVYLARDLKLDRAVALKVLPPALAADAVVRERFLREARTAARLAHPNVVPVHRADEIGGTAFFTMAYVDGESLAERLEARGVMAPADAVRVLRDVAWALAYAHAHGVVHRDVKPENILLDRATGRALVTDFGIAHQREALGEGAARLTRDGHVLGTLHYMSPEQVSGLAVDGRSDLYALGVVAYLALGGRLPFGDLAGPAVLVAHATRPAPPLGSVRPELPAALTAVVDRCLAKDPDARYATGEQMAEALERALATEPGVGQGTDGGWPSDLPTSLSEGEAAAPERRAAQLQADALQRVEATRDLRTRPTSADGYPLADVVAAAQEAGISRQYVAMALAERPRDGAAPLVAPAVDEAQARRFLGTEQRSLAESCIVPATPARALRALGAVLTQPPYELSLRETVGSHPLDGGVIVFDLPGTIGGAGGQSAARPNFFWMGTHQQLEARQVQLTLRALPGDPARTELTMTCDLRPGVRRNVRASQWIAGVMGGLGSTVTGAVLAKGAAVAASAAVLGPAAGVGVVLAGASLAWYRWLYPAVLGKARAEMQRALQAVASSLKAEMVFGTTAPAHGDRAVSALPAASHERGARWDRVSQP